MEAKIVKQCMRDRLPLPDAIANAPTLQLGLDLYFDAFWDLSSCRMSGFTLGPIPWSAIFDYALAYAYDEDQRENLVHYIRVMDNAYRDFYATKTGGKTWRSRTGSGNSPSVWPSKRS